MSEFKSVLAVDIDEVLAGFIPTLTHWYNLRHDKSLHPADYFSYEFHLVWQCTLDECGDEMMKFFESDAFFNDIKPINNALEALKDLNNDYDLHIITARQHIVEEATLKWLETYYPNIFPKEKVHFGNHYSKDGKSRKKSEICKEINAVALIDDSLKYARDLAANKIPCILFGNYGWNSGKLLSHEVPYVRRSYDWEVLKENLSILLNKSSSSSNSIKFSALQMCSGNDTTINLNTILKSIEDAANNGAKFISLPEACLFMGTSIAETQAHCWDNNDTKNLAEYNEIKEISRLSNQCNIWVSIGGFATCDDIKKIEHSTDQIYARKDSNKSLDNRMIYNTMIIISPNKGIVESYSKKHLFDCPLTGLMESNTTLSGKRDCVVLDCGFAKIGLTICYDLRFPEMYTKLRDAGAEIILVPSAFTVKTGEAHWEVLLRSRAIETQCMVIAAAQVGHHNPQNSTRQSWGHTIMIDSWGRVNTLTTEVDTILYGEFNRLEQDQLRSSMPVIDHR